MTEPTARQLAQQRSALAKAAKSLFDAARIAVEEIDEHCWRVGAPGAPFLFCRNRASGAIPAARPASAAHEVLCGLFAPRRRVPRARDRVPRWSSIRRPFGFRRQSHSAVCGSSAFDPSEVRRDIVRSVVVLESNLSNDPLNSYDGAERTDQIKCNARSGEPSDAPRNSPKHSRHKNARDKLRREAIWIVEAHACPGPV
jgi:hypothetical protein